MIQAGKVIALVLLLTAWTYVIARFAQPNSSAVSPYEITLIDSDIAKLTSEVRDLRRRVDALELELSSFKTYGK